MDILVHAHVPKCAGSSINAILEQKFSGRTLTGQRHEINAILSRQPKATNDCQYDVVYGHLHYGFVQRYMDRPCVYFSVTRDPIDRLCSLFNYVQARPEHPLHAAMRANLRSLNDLRDGLDFIDPIDWSNHFSTAYSGLDRRQYSWAAQHNRTIAAVRDGKLVIGTLDEIRRFLEERIGPFVLGRTNATRPPHLAGSDVEFARPAGLSSRVTALLRRWNAEDYRLLDRVAELDAAA